MKAERPKLDEARVKMFLNAGEAKVEQGKTKPEKNMAATTMKKASKKSTVKVLPKRTVTIERNQMVKFMIELPSELRRKIKFESVSSEMPMNSLIVKALVKYFG